MFLYVNSGPLGIWAELWISDTSSQWNLGSNFKHFVAHQSKAFLDHGDVYSSSILLLQGLIQQTLKMCQLVFPLPTFPPSLPPAICFELLAQELFSLWFQKFASHSKKPCYFVLFGTWQESERNTKKKKRIFFFFFFPDDLTHKCSF